VGRVDALGEGVTDFQIGDRVGVGWFGGSCHSCHNCVRENAWVSCPKVVATGGAVDGGNLPLFSF
jgi:D-arabinose 1-dehydrogenase-like Zn-dependent alcohol dehydrogenase